MTDESPHNDAPPPSKTTPVRMALWALLFAILMLLFAALTLITLVYPRPRTLQQSEAARRRALLGNQKERQLAQLNSYGWIDESKHLAHIPIEQAMKQVAAQTPPTP